MCIDVKTNRNTATYATTSCKNAICAMGGLIVWKVLKGLVFTIMSLIWFCVDNCNSCVLVLICPGPLAKQPIKTKIRDIKNWNCLSIINWIRNVFIVFIYTRVYKHL